MGRDKAMLPLGGRTLLGRAVDTLRSVPSLKDRAGRVIVTVVGERAVLEGADRVIADRYPGCGPLGGMEAALRDLKNSGELEWAFFLPVDMPFLPAGLIDALLREWRAAARRGVNACSVVVDGRDQPLVSMMNSALHPFLVEAITAEQFKVTSVLQSAAEVLASCSIDGIGSSNSGFHTTLVTLNGIVPDVAGWKVPGEQESLKRLWFSNLNNEEEFREAETCASSLGSS